MRLTGQQYASLSQALIENFPTREKLAQMLKMRLDKQLEAISTANGLEDINFTLIQTAEAEGWVKDLMAIVEGGSNKITILFLAANPPDGEKLRIDKERREVTESLKASKFRDNFNFKEEWAVEKSKLREYLFEYKPNIVHFSGHGTKDGIILESKSGTSQVVRERKRTLDLESLDSSKVESALAELLVILNACHSHKLAENITKQIDYAIGMSKAVGDPAAISFAKAFYLALAYGESVNMAFKHGCNEIGLSNEQEIPRLHVKEGVDPDRSFI